MHFFAIDDKGGESRRILPSITKGEIVGHKLSLMSIWQYLRGGDKCQRSYQSISEQEEPSKEQAKQTEELSETKPEELSEHIRARGAIGGASEANRAIYASDNIIGSCSGDQNPHMPSLILSGVVQAMKTHICMY